MKKIAISALLLLSACQSFEAGGPAEGQCPKAHIDIGSGICRPLNSLSQQELFVARLRLDEQAQSGAGKESDQARQETQIMINKIIESNRQRSAKEESNRSETERSRNQSAIQSIGQRTTPVSSKRTDMTDFGQSLHTKSGRN